MKQKSKATRLLAWFVAIVMMASMFSMVTVSASQYTFALGEFDELESDGWGWQSRWNVGAVIGEDGEVEEAYSIPIEALRLATHIVLEFDEEPMSDIELIVMGDGNNWGWKQAHIARFDEENRIQEDEILSVTASIADVAEALDWENAVSGDVAALILGSNALSQVLTSAHLVLSGPLPGDNGTATQPPVDTTPAEGQSVLILTLGSTTYTLNGLPGTLEVAANSIDGRTMVPFRFLGDKLGATTDWDDATKTASFTLGATTTSVVIGQPLPNEMGTPIIENGRTLVPAAFVAASMGADVAWDAVARTVTITFGEAEAPVVELPTLPVDDEECDDDDCEDDHDHDEDLADDGEEEEVVVDTTPAVAVEGAPTGNVLRAEQKDSNGHGSVQFTVSANAGDEYTLSFWAYNAAGRESVLAQWSHWPTNYASIDGDEAGLLADPGVWTFLEYTFTVPATDNTLIQVVPGSGAPGDVFYIADVTVTDSEGTATEIPLTSLRGHWGPEAIVVSVVPAP